jgi:hypothetical protein
MDTADLLGILLHCGLHRERGITGAHSVVLKSDGGTKQRHDAVAQHLVDSALVAMHGVHHALQDRIEELSGLLGVALGQ